MLYVIYLLYLVSAVLLGIAIWRAVAADISASFPWIIAAGVCAILGAAISWHKMGGEINKEGYARVRRAAAKSSDADAMAQWALSDNVITVSEYATIAEAYRNQTGGDINEVKAK